MCGARMFDRTNMLLRTPLAAHLLAVVSERQKVQQAIGSPILAVGILLKLPEAVIRILDNQVLGWIRTEL